jgi:hypothetical protein
MEIKSGDIREERLQLFSYPTQPLPLMTPSKEKSLCEFLGDLFRGKFFSPSASDNDNILMKGDFLTVAAKRLSQAPLD